MNSIDFFLGSDYSYSGLKDTGLLQKSRLWGEGDASSAFRRNLALMDYQNFYNSPEQTMKRLTDAGVNPFVAAAGLAGYNNSASFTAQGDDLVGQKRAAADTFIGAFNSALDIAGKLVGILENGGSLESRILKNQSDAGVSYLNQLLKNEELLDIRSLADFYSDEGTLENGLESSNIIPYTSRVKGAASGVLSTERSRAYNESSQRRINELNSSLNRLLKSKQSRRLDYEYENLLPVIRRKYNLTNEQINYLNQSLSTFDPEVRSVIMMLLSIGSVLK